MPLPEGRQIQTTVFDVCVATMTGNNTPINIEMRVDLATNSLEDNWPSYWMKGSYINVEHPTNAHIAAVDEVTINGDLYGIFFKVEMNPNFGLIIKTSAVIVFAKMKLWMRMERKQIPMYDAEQKVHNGIRFMDRIIALRSHWQGQASIIFAKNSDRFFGPISFIDCQNLARAVPNLKIN